MDLRAEPMGRYARILAVISLVMGLADAARLLGLGTAMAQPIASLGVASFTLLAIFCVMRLFASVGLWVRARWGAVLLASATGVEIGLYLGASTWIRMGLIDFIFKLALFLATIGLLLIARRHALRSHAD